jgi:hypothetical protein
MTRIRTLEFLPPIFQTETNSQFLAATLDQLVNPPVTKKIQGYVGSKFGYGINAKDYYVTEPTKNRRNYQLEPGVTFLKENETTAKDFISYPGILDALALQGSQTKDNTSLFESQFYSFDSFTNLDMMINYNQYYWLPDGPPAVTVSASTVYTVNDYQVTALPAAYNIKAIGSGAGTNNPTLVLLRGGTYNFIVDQSSEFWIQGAPGITGYDPTQPNQYTRDVYGVNNNGAKSGVVTFNVPQKDAQNEYNFPGDNSVGVISTLPFSQVNGARLSDLQSIDGVTALNGRTVLFYNTGQVNEIGYVSAFYGSTPFDVNDGLVSTETITATSITNTGLLTVSDVANLTIGDSVTFTGTSFGGIEPYLANTANAISDTSLTVGEVYYINSLGNTDWIDAGVTNNAVLNAEISGTQLIVHSVISGAFSIGQIITGAGVASGTTIIGYDKLASLTTGVETYIVNNSQTVSTTSINAYDIQPGKIFTCANVPSSGGGTAAPFSPVIYYINGINPATNEITISKTLGGDTYTPVVSDSGTMTVYINQGLYEEGYYTNVDDNFYTIEYVGDADNPILRLTPTSIIPIGEKITPLYGSEYVGLHFVKNVTGVIQLLPYISAPLDTLYYQDSSVSSRVGTIKLIENNETNTINVDVDILGKQNYTAKNGVVFTNGLKVQFNGDVVPRSYLEGQYYVQGVGTERGIELINTNLLIVPEPFTTLSSIPYDSTGYDIGPYDAGLNIPSVQDYITIARNSINQNAWSRSNRWFHIQVIQATAQYNSNPSILDEFATPDNKAKRPIIEFYPNLKLFNSGSVGKQGIDFIDYRTTDAFNLVEGQQNYYPDVETYTKYTGTIYTPPNVTLEGILSNQYYQILSLGLTTPNTWIALGSEQDSDGGFEVGVEYIITDLGTLTQAEWNAIAGTTAVTYNVESIFTCAYPGAGGGGGTALKTLFKSTGTGITESQSLVAGNQYTIITLGTTQWQNIGASATPTVGEIFTATGSAFGTGTAIQGDGTAKSKTVTTISIPADDIVTGTFSQGAWINDLIINEQSRLPTGTRILSIDNNYYSYYVLTVYWPIPTDVLATISNASFVSSTKDNTDLQVFAGARIVFAGDTDSQTRNKIFVVNFNNTGSEPFPVINLTEAFDSPIVENDQFYVSRGFNYKGFSFYYDGTEYIQAQQKQIVNQAPLFDLFDENGRSYGNKAVYQSTTFKGNKLFNYKLGVGVDDTILGFPISYSSINNVGDISFQVYLNTETFDYIDNGNSITSTVKNGFVHNYLTSNEFVRLTGWQTAVAPSTQYQAFLFNYTANITPLVLTPDETFDYTFTVDIPQLNVDKTIWPSLLVYNNNEILTEGVDYTVENTSSSTIITVKLNKDVDTPIQVLILSDKTSSNAYYTIPINLSNNPFNEDPVSVDIGDIRGQYQSIFDNNPDTTGQVFGSNNYRDLGNLVPWGTKIIQNSASLVLPGAFLREPRFNLSDSLLFNSREYIKYKTLLVDAINRIANDQKFDPSLLLDEAIADITATKNQEQPFFWSDMLPNKAAYISNVYTFANDSDTSIFPLSRVYDFTSANYYGLLVYIQRTIQGVVTVKQLIIDIDYNVSTDSPSLTITKDLLRGDKVIIKEYNQTYGSYVPNTPTKLGLYPAYVPSVVLDTTYSQPTYFIQGHDGSYNKLYGDYNETLGMLIDFRDQILLEFETRIYNNLKLSRTLPFNLAETIPGYFRDTALDYAEWTSIYSKNFLDWVGQNRLDYKVQLYKSNDPYTYNYRESTLKLENSLVLQGNWRGIYTYLYDTSTPNLTPWAMIGYSNKPDWWEDRYGPAPYTSDNLLLWQDMEDGYDYNNGVPVIRTLYKRKRDGQPGLMPNPETSWPGVIPVDSDGNLRQPLDAVISNYNNLTFQRSWRVGDDAPVEYSYRKSSTYPFDLIRLQSLLKPAEFYNLGADLDNYKYNVEFDQFLVNGRTHLIPDQIQIYGNGVAKTSYINWIVDYEKQLGVDATANITKLLSNLDVRLVFRLAGFSDKTLLKFFVEKSTPDSRNSSLMIPDESYQVLLYQNVPEARIVYSGVIVQLTSTGYAVFGNNQTNAYFKILKPIVNGPKEKIDVQDAVVNVCTTYSTDEEIVPYGTIFYTITEVSQFLLSYGAYLTSKGAVFDDQVQNIVINWSQMVAEFLYWSQTGWSVGSVLTLNPAASKLTIDKESLVVEPLTYAQTNFVLNNNLYPIQNKDLNIVRDSNKFSVTALNAGDAISYGQFNLSNIEHGIVFQNTTLFNDVIYNLVSGLKQNRIYVRGTKSAEWNGTMFASGFIYNQDNVEQWNPEVKYTRGSVVKYKNKFFTALTIVQPGKEFKQNEWRVTDYDELQKGLLPNSSTRSYESTLYYNADEANLENDADLLSFSLIGFRPREYMASADLTDITQVNVYKNLIKQKGTLNAMKAFKGANLPQGGIDYDVYENWAILQGTFGGVLNANFLELKLYENLLTGNPAIIGLTDGNNVEGAQQLTPLYSLFNYGRPLDSAYVLPLLPKDTPNQVYPNAGYVNLDDVKMSAYFYSNLPTAVNKNNIIVPIGNLYVGDYVWLADYQSSWQILTPTSIGQVVQVRSNINNTCVVTFNKNHNLTQYDIFSIINFDSSVNGYYVATQIINPREVLINLTLPNSTTILTGQGIGLKFATQRVAQPSDIQNLPLQNSQFVKNTVWVDTNTDGDWAVYRKNIAYKFDVEFARTNSIEFGTSVAYTKLSDYLIGDAPLGKVIRYQYDSFTETYEEDQTLTNDVSFGSSITHEQNIYAISQPTTNPTVFLYTVNNTTVSDNIIPYQTITAASNVATSGSTNFGSATALSGDLNWLFISDYNEATPTARNKVHVYHRNNTLTSAGSFTIGATYQITSIGTTDFTTVGAVSNEVGIYFIAEGVGSGDGIATQCDYQYCKTINSGSTSPDLYGQSIATNYYGTTLVVGAPHVDTDIVENYGNAYVYDRLVQNIEINQAYNSLEPAAFNLAWTPNSTFTTVTKNGIVVDSSNYSFVGSILEYSGEFQYGDIITVSGDEFVLIQTFTNQQTPRTGVKFGYSLDTNTFGTEILIGAPFYLDSQNIEGGVFRYTYGSARFGYIVGDTDVDVTTTRQLLINGYLVEILAGDADQAAAVINSAKITNIVASAVDGKLMIGLANQDIANVNQELLLSAPDPDTFTELGLEVYKLTQIIQNPNQAGASQFGTTVKFNEHNSVAVSAPVATRYALTTFDFTDDANYNNDTIFDNNSTQFLDSFNNAGAVYTFDYLGNFHESLTNIGAYTFAQSVNSQSLVYGSQPKYGFAIDWHDNKIIVGSPYFSQTLFDGQVIIYKNVTGTNNWVVHRQSNPIVDINKVENIQIFSAETNNTLINLDYIDPLQGKILGAVRQNLDIVGNTDPASYNNVANIRGIVWGSAQVGTIWFDTSNIRYLNYHQNDNVYNSRYWGQLFPGSDVAVYTWIGSSVPPLQYQGAGIPKDVTAYTVQTVINSSNTVTPVYFFWVRNSGIIFGNKTLADVSIAGYIANPQSSGISYFAPLAQDTFAIYNCKPYINANDSVLHIGYVTGQQDNPGHSQYDLIRTNYADDFLPGVPGSFNITQPESLYDRLLDSMAGVDEGGATVPNPFLPKAVQSGILARPRQSFFYNRFKAMQNYLQYANSIMKIYPIAEMRTFNYLNKEGTYYNTTNYWKYVNWWAPGYDDSTKPVLQVQIYADLSTLNVANGTIVNVAMNNKGSTETYRYDSIENYQGNYLSRSSYLAKKVVTYNYTNYISLKDVPPNVFPTDVNYWEPYTGVIGSWVRIGVENGTIQFNSDLFDYQAAGYGFGGTFYDTDSYDIYPSEETRWIMRALNEQIYTNELLIFRNKSLILLFEYIQEETVENQNYLPWLNKTSLVDVSHKVRELKELENFVSDNEQFLEGYVNETKPYHVVVKEFLFDYTGTNVYPGTLTDFDLPAVWDSTINKFVSPQLVYQQVNNDYEFLPDSPVWQEQEYSEWYNNYGLSLAGQDNYPISTIKTYVTTISEVIFVSNIESFPANGTITIGEENISYASVDRLSGYITGLTRGVNQTVVTNHLPGAQIFINLPGVVLLETGRNYANPPRVLAQIDLGQYPAPKVEAVLEAEMSAGSVIGINIIDPGQGYAITPEIVIDPSDSFEFNSSNVNILTNTIEIYAPVLATGDLVRYIEGNINIGGLSNKEYYYINVLDSNPTTILALYNSYSDSINDTNRVKLLSQGSGTQKFDIGARAIPITSSSPVRENNITIRFDRTSYTSQITDWTPNTFYGSEFVGYYLNSSSTSLSLASVQPDINILQASAEGTVFPIFNVSNDRQLDWSSFERTGNSIGANNNITLSYTSSIDDLYPSGSTVGFTIGMPVKFTGNVGTNITAGVTYYVSEIDDLNSFKISETELGPTKVLAPNANVSLTCYTAKVTDTAIITTEYNGIREITGTSASNNTVTIPLTEISSAGTTGMYQKLPVTFSGTLGGGLEDGRVYYVLSLLGSESFSVSENDTPITVIVTSTNLANQLFVQNTNGLAIDDPIVFDSISINGSSSNTFGNIEKQKIYYILTIGVNEITISETKGGPVFTTGVVTESSGNYCYITSQTTAKTLTNSSFNGTVTLSLPVSPGQVNGQQLTFYPTSQNFANITGANLVYGNLIQTNINAALASTNIISVESIKGMYTNFPFTVDANISTLQTGKTYYAYDVSKIQVYIKTTTAETTSFEATFTGDEMNVTSITGGTPTLYPGSLITGTGVEENTYIVSYGTGSGGVGTYTVNKIYFVPVTTTDAESQSGVLTLADDYTTDMIYEGMPIKFSGAVVFGNLVPNFTYYVRYIINSTTFTVSEVLMEGATVTTIGNGNMLGTGSNSAKVYLPVGTLIDGDQYEIKNLGTTDEATWQSLGATYVLYGGGVGTTASVVAGNYYIINDTNTTSNLFWSVVAGTNVTVAQNDIIYAEVSSTMSSVLDGTAFKIDFTCTSSPQTGNGQATVVLTDDISTVKLNQEIIQSPTFDVGYVLGGYNVIINDGGLGFTQNNTITIPGTALGGLTPDNDLILTVSRINALVSGTYSWSLPEESNGIITKVIASGTPIGLTSNYFVKVDGENTFKLYSDPLLTIPVSGLTLPYEGITQTTIANVVSSTNDINLYDATNLDINDAIVFTELNDSGFTIEEGSKYYIVYKSGNTIRVSDNPGGSVISISSVTIPVSGSYLPGEGPVVAKAGSFALLSEPFYFNPSIVKYNNRVWMCIVSNNDSEFMFGKWEELNSGNRKLNALDRAVGWYRPTVNMPGLDLPQLFTGLTYPNATYKGNKFEPDQQFALDTQLVDRPFDITHINIPKVVFNGTNYIGPINTPAYSGMVADLEVTDDWAISVLANQTLDFTDIIKVQNLYVVTSTNKPTPILISSDQVNWNTNGYIVPLGTPANSIEFDKVRLIASGLELNSVVYHNNLYVAAGNKVVTSANGTLWFERGVLASTQELFDVQYVTSADFDGYITVGKNGAAGLILISEDGLNWENTTPSGIVYSWYAATSGFNNIYVVGNFNIIAKSTDGINWIQVNTPTSGRLNDILFADNTLVAVGENGLLLVSTDGNTFVQKTTGTTETLNGISYVSEKGEWTIVGNNNTVLQTTNITAPTITWDNTQIFTGPQPKYTVVGDPFQAGYGPEEMVPGNVDDNVTIIVNTRAGTNWPAVEYAHVGYDVVSTIYDLNTENEYTFANIVQTPAYISVFKVTDGVGISLYDTLDYTVDWVNKTVTLNDILLAGEQLRIDVYQVGNGDQLVKSSTDEDPIELNEVTGFSEIALDCNYTRLDFNGNGIVQPDSYPISVEATETDSGNDYIICTDISQFTVNDEITFVGAVFGGVVANVPYYVKSINEVRKAITISDTLISGVAGPTFDLSTDTGSMIVVIQKTSGQFYTEPAVFCNGIKLNSGLTNYVISTKSSNNSIVTFSTSGLIVDQPIVFSNTIFGGITHGETYYIHEILSATEFTIEDQYGNVVVLTNGSGTAIFITNDYAAMLADNQINAKIVFAKDYDIAGDYISYSFFGKTEPLQYGYTLPQTQTFNGDGTQGPYTLDNFIGGDNPQNAIVEINGLRLTPDQYGINFAGQEITFVSISPNITDNIAVTTFNDTERQYLFTNTFTNNTTSAITSINTLASPVVVTTSTNHNLVNNDVIRIDGCVGATQLNNDRFIVQKLTNTTIALYEYIPGQTYNTSAPIQYIDTYISGGYVWIDTTYIIENMYVTSSGYNALTEQWTLNVSEVDGLVAGTPVYFTEDNIELGDPTSVPQVIAGQKYYIKGINEFTNEFTISATLDGAALTLSSQALINIRVTQWEQTNTDRLWVTVAGKRVNSNNLVIYEGNQIGILTEISSSDEVVITSMMPSATPNAQTYINIVDKDNQGKVYRANTDTRTWLADTVGEYDTNIVVHDVTKLVDTTTQNNTTPAAVLGYHSIGLLVKRFDILQVRVFNNNPARLGYIDQDYLKLEVFGIGPYISIESGSWIETGDELTIIILEGKTLYVKGEYMNIINVDLNNHIINVQRGAQGSPVNSIIPKYTTIYGLLTANKMSNTYYNQTWNPIPGVYNTTKGDPLQIASGIAPDFLNMDVT